MRRLPQALQSLESSIVRKPRSPICLACQWRLSASATTRASRPRAFVTTARLRAPPKEPVTSEALAEAQSADAQETSLSTSSAEELDSDLTPLDPDETPGRYTLLAPIPTADEDGKVPPDPQGNYRTTYTPAVTWDELAWVAKPGQIYHQEAVEVAERLGGRFSGYTPRKEVRELARLEEAVQRAVKEVLVLQVLASDLRGMKALGTDGSERHWSQQVDLSVKSDGTAFEVSFSGIESVNAAAQDFGFEGGEQLDKLRSVLKASGTVEGAATRFEPSGGKQSSPQDNWRNLSIESLSLRFALTKRLFQLTGLKPTDNELRTTTTLGKLHDRLIVASKPQQVKLAQTLKTTPELQPLKNVKVEMKRRTMVHREKAVGRWKVIERELVERRLPVFGR